jgi:DNA-binding transcriptional ArsR family regulator
MVGGERTTLLCVRALIATYYASVANTQGAQQHDEVTPERIRTSDPELLRALAHPARLAIIEHLAAYGGEITATEAAEVVGLSPSATSYHLRALAKVNMIREAPSRGDGRERVYTGAAARKVEITTDPDTTDLAGRLAGEKLLDAILQRNDERIRRWRASMNEEPKEWADASVIHEALIMITAPEMAEITQRLMDVLEPYRRSRREVPPEGARLVAYQLRGIPVR